LQRREKKAGKQGLVASGQPGENESDLDLDSLQRERKLEKKVRRKVEETT